MAGKFIEMKHRTATRVSLDNGLGLKSSYIMLFVLGILFAGCEHDPQEPGYVYFPDMAYSVPYETYAPNPIFADGKTAQPSVEGTIPREMIPYFYPKTDEGMAQAGKELKNPFEVNGENLFRGEKEYNIYCSLCHGKDGQGKGMLYKSGKYPSEPASLVSEDMWDRPEGEFYHVITMGSAIMASHASQIRSQDRWKIVMYIKTILQKAEKQRLENQ